MSSLVSKIKNSIEMIFEGSEQSIRSVLCNRDQFFRLFVE